MGPLTPVIVETHYKCSGCRLWVSASLQVCQFCGVPAAPSSLQEMNSRGDSIADTLRNCPSASSGASTSGVLSSPNSVSRSLRPASGPVSAAGTHLDAQVLRKICKEAGLPMSPTATTQLPLTGQRLLAMDRCLTLYPEVNTLWLDQNKIRRINNLQHLTKIKCLFLQGNQISRVEGLASLSQLEVLDLSSNCISRLEGLAVLPQLHTLLVADNRLRSTVDIRHLASCARIHELSLAENFLGEPDGLLDVLGRLPQLEVLAVRGNPLAHEQHARRLTRRQLLMALGQLKSVDGRAVHPSERKHINSQQSAQQEAGSDPDACMPPAVCAHLLQEALPVVLSRITDCRLLANMAMVCTTWRSLCIIPVAAARLATAQQRLNEASATLDSLMADQALTQMGHADVASFLECMNPIGPVVQLVNVLHLLWQCRNSNARSAELHGPVTQVPDLAATSWRVEAWEAAMPMMECPDFPYSMIHSGYIHANLDAATVQQLRAITGSADDLDEYVPELDCWAIDRFSSTAGRLCAWVLAVEAKAWASVLLVDARSAARSANIFVAERPDFHRIRVAETGVRAHLQTDSILKDAGVQGCSRIDMTASAESFSSSTCPSSRVLSTSSTPLLCDNVLPTDAIAQGWHEVVVSNFAPEQSPADPGLTSFDGSTVYMHMDNLNIQTLAPDEQEHDLSQHLSSVSFKE